MCLIAFACDAHPDYPLIVAANRDEYRARPTAAAAWWPDRDLLAGRDLDGGGTWMGITRAGRFAALTNVRDPARQRADAPTRGLLVTDVLRDARGIEAAMDEVAVRAAAYNGFNLLAGRWQPGAPRASMWLVSSHAHGAPVRVEAGVHALSNALLDTPWPKVSRASAILSALVADRVVDDALETALFELLLDRAIAPDAELPRTGIPHAMERALSAALIDLPDYGTRTATVVLVDRAGRVRFVERDIASGRAWVDERRFAFALDNALERAAQNL